MRWLLLIPILFCVETSIIGQSNHSLRPTISLAGEWEFALDPANKGIHDKWYLGKLGDSIVLPGTTDTNKKGYLNTDTTTMHLNRVYWYEGAAWYQRKVSIPEAWRGHRIRMTLERTKPSQIWLDGHQMGSSLLLESPQEFYFPATISPGDHVITIRIDNSLRLTPYGNVHIYSDDTQTNWNGVLGVMKLEALGTSYIDEMQVYPDVEASRANIRIKLGGERPRGGLDVHLELFKEGIVEGTPIDVHDFRLAADSLLTLQYVIPAPELWDEYRQPLYRIKATVKGPGFSDSLTVVFGMRKFEARGTQFVINGRVTFLRGKHDACVFPLTGHPPMTKPEWVKVFNIARSYGINHYRFHSWCPPAAAFDAADETGIYLQPELPFWGGLDSDSIANRLLAEGRALMRAYGNHPSFVLFSPGNELWSGHERALNVIRELKRLDPRHLYAQGSNNSIGYAAPAPGTDFHVAARTPSQGDTVRTHIRLTHAFADSRDGGLLNTSRPSTSLDFDYPVSSVAMPLISHEIGQYQIYPDFNEIAKYTGVLRASNLAVFRKRLEKSGMLDENLRFQKASGAWAALCYKAEMETALRTKGFGGFQLLDLQDFPGQGTALVGILDAFMDTKNVISRRDWLASCNDVVAMLKFQKYCWVNTEIFRAEVVIANYSATALDNPVSWQVAREDGTVLSKGAFDGRIGVGALHSAGQIEFPLSGVSVPTKLIISVALRNSDYQNQYPIWIYPDIQQPAPGKVKIVHRLDDRVLKQLKRGARVLLFHEPETGSVNTVGGLFPPDFWNFGMFKGISESVKKPVSPGTLGLLMDPRHPLFGSFPTDHHTNWQWWSIVRNSNPLILDETDRGYRPIVQVIDNMERNHKLALIFEFKVGAGKLLVCMSDLQNSGDPEARQLYASILDYMNSDNFDPASECNEQVMRKLGLLK